MTTFSFPPCLTWYNFIYVIQFFFFSITFFQSYFLSLRGFLTIGILLFVDDLVRIVLRSTYYSIFIFIIFLQYVCKHVACTIKLQGKIKYIDLDERKLKEIIFSKNLRKRIDRRPTERNTEGINFVLKTFKKD